MDTSLEYIKMCEQAGEIQANYPGKHYHLHCPDNAGYLVDTEYSLLYRHKLGDSTIWLPRQDQLQEMVLGFWGYKDGQERITTWKVVTRRFLEFQVNLGNDYCRKNWNASMEQLWLAFVMKENHNKVWDGEEWRCL